MRTAKASNDERVKLVVALREKLGIGEGDLETRRVARGREVRPRFDQPLFGERGVGVAQAPALDHRERDVVRNRVRRDRDDEVRDVHRGAYSGFPDAGRCEF